MYLLETESASHINRVAITSTDDEYTDSKHTSIKRTKKKKQGHEMSQKCKRKHFQEYVCMW